MPSDAAVPALPLSGCCPPRPASAGGENILRRAVGRHRWQLFGLCLSVLEDGRDGEAHQQDAGHGPRKPDDAAGAASAAPARAMIIV
ncbi:MAG: hypothetical protein ACLUIR_11675 [Faecalibacterium prausnitzii]